MIGLTFHHLSSECINSSKRELGKLRLGMGSSFFIAKDFVQLSSIVKEVIYYGFLYNFIFEV
jgi:hypothetical protein